MYPTNWPRCPMCGDYALDGHITCGKVQCEEGRQGDLNRPDDAGAGCPMEGGRDLLGD
jgi:hypothetical protein